MGATECHWVMESRKGVCRVQHSVHACGRPGTRGSEPDKLAADKDGGAMAMGESKDGGSHSDHDSIPVLSVDRRGLVESLAANAGHERITRVNPAAAVAYGVSAVLLCAILWLLITLHWEVDLAQEKLNAANEKLRTISITTVKDMKQRFDAEVLRMADDPIYFKHRVESAKRANQ